MKRSVNRLLRDNRGASLAEFALLFPIFALLTFGVLEMGYLAWQLQQGALASKRAVRIAATRQVIAPGAIPDCGPGTGGAAPGTLCADLTPSSNSWGSCTGAGGSPCGADIATITQEITAFYPRATADKIRYEFSGGGLGFVGLGKPVPIVTVRFVGVQFDFIVLKGFGIGPVNMPPLSASAPAEDLTNGPGG